MQTPATDNLNVVGLDDMPPPSQVKRELPLEPAGAGTVQRGREQLTRILDREDARLFVVVGPCSIHDPAAALDYARRLRALADELADVLLLVMRVYFEKPRTVTGWKGFINDPDMDDSFRIGLGMRRARELLLAFADLGLPTGSEALDPLSPQYLADLISWYAIGARTTESQTHREMASGLSTPVGFKNGTDGSLDVAINAIRSARSPHSFLGIGPDGRAAIVRTRGNRLGHVVLRGGGGRPNYDTVSVRLAEAALQKRRSAGQHRRRLLAQQFDEGPGVAAAGVHGLRAPDQGRQPLDRRTDAGEQPWRGQPADPGRPRAAALRCLGNRRLHRLGNHRRPAATRRRRTAPGPRGTREPLNTRSARGCYRFTGIVNSGPLLDAGSGQRCMTLL